MVELSIITINLNDKVGLSRTIDSIINQDFKEFELIIIDGGSSDGSFEVIEQNKANINYWVSEKDNGIYDAMNKGVEKANGNYLLFLNSGDYLISNEALNYDFSLFDHDILYGHLTFQNNGKFYTSVYNDILDLGFFFRTTLPHGSTFIKKELFSKYGKYRLDFQIVSDWIFFLERILVDKCSTLHLDKPVSVFEIGGISTRPENQIKVKLERLNYIESKLPEMAISYIRKSLEIEEKYKNLGIYISELQTSHQAEINNLKRLKGFKLLKKINNIFDRLHSI